MLPPGFGPPGLGPPGFPTPGDFGCDGMNARYNPMTGDYHYSYFNSDANARISFDVNRAGDYVGGLHMTSQGPAPR